MRPGRSINVVAATVGIACLSAPVLADPPADLELAEIADVPGAVAIASPGDGSGRLFVASQSGTISLLDLTQATPIPTTFLSLAVLSGGELGLLGLAFHPDFPAEPRFFVNYNPDGVSRRTRISEFEISAGAPDVADPMSERILLEISQPHSNHNGGQIAFGPDGYLYVGMGDGGGQYDPDDRAQDRGDLLGKILRIDVDGSPPGQPNDLCGSTQDYGVPVDNPYAGGSGDCDEIWAVGFRNPWRFSFDRATGDLVIGDVGQDEIEEIDFQPASSAGGENYAWPCKEGGTYRGYGDCLDDAGDPIAEMDLPGQVVEPVVDYTHSSGSNCSVSGGFVYRGSKIPGLAGTYVYGDYCTGRIWFATPSGGGSWSASEWATGYFTLTSFGEDDDGELYLASSGTVYRFESPSSIFGDGFEYGDTSPWSATTP